MKKIVKILALLMAVLMLLSVCAGCAPKDPEGPNQGDPSAKDYKDTEFRLAWWGGDVRHNATMAALKEFDKKFTNLETQVTYSGWAEFFPTIIDINIAGQTCPDVFQMTREKLPAYAEYNLVKLDDYIASGAIDTSKIADNDLQLGYSNDGIYAIATGTNCTVYVYSTSDAAAAGVTLSRTPTLDELVAAAKAVYAKTGKKVVLEFAEYVRMRGASYYNEDGTAVGFSAQILTDWWKFEAQAIKDGWMVGPTDGIDGGKSGAIDGKVWCFTTYSNQIVSCETDTGLDLEWMAVPGTSENMATSYSQPNTLWVVSNQTKNPDLAVALVNFLINDTAYFDACGFDRGMPISSAMREYMEPKMGESEALQKEILEVLTEAGSFGPMPAVSSKDGEAKSELTDYMQQNQYGMIKEADMLKTAEEAIAAMNDVLG